MEFPNFGYENLTGGTTYNTTMSSMNFGFGIFMMCLLIVTFIVGFIGNGLVIFLTGCRMKTTVNSIWFLNLAIADFTFIFSLIILPFTMYFFPLRVLYILSMATSLNLLASVFFLAVISLDRCLCTWMAVWAQNNRTVLRARIISLIVWVLSICCCIPFFFVFPAEFMFTFSYAFSSFLVGFLIPFLIIASSHIAIGVRIKRFKMGKRLRSYRGIIAVILTFFICCFPCYVCYFCLRTAKIDNWSARDLEVYLIAVMFSSYLVYLNSALNPILYVFMCDEYKKKLKQSLLLVLETAFTEDHLDFRVKQRMSRTTNPPLNC